MKKSFLLTSLLLAASLAAHATENANAVTNPPKKAPAKRMMPMPKPQLQFDQVKHVAYQCGSKGEQKLHVLYGITGQELVAAQVMYGPKKRTPVLLRDLRVAKDSGVSFVSGGIVWNIDDSATVANIDKVDGNMLTVAGTDIVNGEKTAVNNIVAKYCVLDKEAMARRPHPPKACPKDDPNCVKRSLPIKDKKEAIKSPTGPNRVKKTTDTQNKWWQ